MRRVVLRLLLPRLFLSASAINVASFAAYRPHASGCIVIAEMSSSRSPFSWLHLRQARRIRFHCPSSFPLGTKDLPMTCSLLELLKSSRVPQYGHIILSSIIGTLAGHSFNVFSSARYHRSRTNYRRWMSNYRTRRRLIAPDHGAARETFSRRDQTLRGVDDVLGVDAALFHHFGTGRA